MKPIINHPSPNFDTRMEGFRPSHIVLHYTGMPSDDGALKRLCDPAAKVSAHYMIDEAGQIHKLVSDQHRAWHAGQSYWRGLTDLNSASIGIELGNPGHEFGYRAFPKIQIDSLKELLLDLTQRHHLDAYNCLLAHSDIAPRRKQDPGELFPWKELADMGLGLWPEDTSGLIDSNASELLSKIGYDTTDVEAAVLAFQRRFDPDHLGEPENPRLLARLSAVCAAWK